MTAEELTRIDQRLSELKPVLTEYAFYKMQEKGVKEFPCLSGSVVIEFNTEGGDTRVLLRQKSGLCFVMSLHSGNIITVYQNEAADMHHHTLHREQYSKSLKAEW